MSVDDRLRSGLAANAGSLLPAGESRLDDVRRRHRRRRAVVAAAAAVVVLALGATTAGWLASGPGPDSVGPAREGRVHVSPFPEIPASSWRKVVTREQLVAAGADEAFLRENIGSAQLLPLLLGLSGDVFSQSGRYPGGWTVGDAGAVSYDDEGRLVLTSNSPGCTGCVATLDWRIEKGELHLSDAAGTLAPIDRVFYVGTWRSADG